MEKIEEIIKNTNGKTQEKINWTKAWSMKYSILKKYQKEVDISNYKEGIRNMLNELQKKYGYSQLDAMLVLKDILYHEYLNKK